MKKTLSLLAFASCGILLFSQCTKDQAPVPKVVVTTPACDSTKVLYCNQMKTLFDQSCATSGCHNSGSSYGDFTTLAGIKAKINDVKDRAIVIKDMPPSGPLSDPELNTLSQWINEGAN